ncbi:hypothetical protein HUN08_17305 [Gordonia sp. X0973]|uniref:hypothetical protein n=1 Tax=Gordonia sp. X0973 TaxID=2742602 RepID=UPI000F542A47|nr:hypothetical protein [Gordonia sp. X0973]QKT08763.1 hypothetical protein HUN08_17305 [Gordonia sp. X0973]
MNARRSLATIAAAVAVATGATLTSAPSTAHAAPGQWYGPVLERSGQAEFWLLGTTATSGWYYTTRYGGIYRVVLQQRDENRYGVDRLKSWKTIAAFGEQERFGSRRNIWNMRWGARFADFRLCRQKPKWLDTRQENFDCSRTVRMFGPSAPHRPRGGGNGGGGGNMEWGATG